MTTTAIPQTSAEILAAQASAGQAGVAAYEQAQAAMGTARTQAVTDAMTAAESRGAPAAAMESALGSTNEAYDRRDAALITAKAAYQDMLASRQGRMLDYSGAVGEARGLIGDQAAQAVAPIDAQSRFAVAGIEAQGRQRVDAINAEARLKQLQMEAAAAARGGGGGGRGGGGGGGGSDKKPSLSQSELAAGVTARATNNLQRARGGAEQAMRQTAEQERQAGSYTAQSANYGTRLSAEQRRRNQMAAEAARQAAAYTAKAAAEYAAKQTPTGLLGGNTASFGVPGAPVPPPLPVRPQPVNPQVAATKTAYEQAAALSRYPTRPTPSGPSAATRAALVNMPLYASGQSFLTPQQIDAMATGPDAGIYNEMLATGGLQRIGEVGERLGLSQRDASTYAPGEINPLTGLPYQLSAVKGQRVGGLTEMNPMGSDALRAAMWQAGVDMEAEGYKIDANELQNVLDSSSDIYEPGDAAYDVMSRQKGGLSFRDQYTAATDARDAQQEAAAKAAKDQADAEWTNGQRSRTMAEDELADYNDGALVQLNKEYGPWPNIPNLQPIDAYDMLSDETNNALFEQGLSLIEKAKATPGPTGKGIDSSDVMAALQQTINAETTPDYRTLLAILEQFY